MGQSGRGSLRVEGARLASMEQRTAGSLQLPIVTTRWQDGAQPVRRGPGSRVTWAGPGLWELPESPSGGRGFCRSRWAQAATPDEGWRLPMALVLQIALGRVLPGPQPRRSLRRLRYPLPLLDQSLGAWDSSLAPKWHGVNQRSNGQLGWTHGAAQVTPPSCPPYPHAAPGLGAGTDTMGL